ARRRRSRARASGGRPRSRRLPPRAWRRRPRCRTARPPARGLVRASSLRKLLLLCRRERGKVGFNRNALELARRIEDRTRALREAAPLHRKGCRVACGEDVLEAHHATAAVREDEALRVAWDALDPGAFETR